MSRYYYDEDYIMEKAIKIQKRELIKEARQHLKKEVQEEIDNLKKENQALQDMKADYNAFKQKERELEELKSKLERDYQLKCESLESDFARKQIEDILRPLIGSLIKPMYRITRESVQREKCPLCDDKRQYTLLAPDGEKYTVWCKCSLHKDVFSVKKPDYFRVYMKVNKDSYQKDLSPTLIMRHRTPSEFEIYDKVENIVEKFDENNLPKNYSNVLFSSEEEAQKYCDYLNSLEED